MAENNTLFEIVTDQAKQIGDIKQRLGVLETKQDSTTDSLKEHREEFKQYRKETVIVVLEVIA